MKKFLAVYTGSAAGTAAWNALPEAERQQRMGQGFAAWQKWLTDNKASIVEIGGPLSKTTLINKAGISDIRNNLSAFTIVQAESQQAAAKLFVNHPQFTLFPG
ncbi:MAG TPA: hypothetical protein VMH83_04435, partial [Candidatus Acidoferrum sp.]|nr:hypothetical protein [Candidatus Acidoferrum sp.]